MNEIVKCDSCGRFTPATGFCRVDGFMDSEGFWVSASVNLPVGICPECDRAWEEACDESLVGQK